MLDKLRGPVGAAGTTASFTTQANGTPTPCQVSPAAGGANAICNPGNLAQGARAEVRIRVTLTGSGTISATAIGKSLVVGDSVQANNTARATITVGP